MHPEEAGPQYRAPANSWQHEVSQHNVEKARQTTELVHPPLPKAQLREDKGSSRPDTTKAMLCIALHWGNLNLSVKGPGAGRRVNNLHRRCKIVVSAN